MNPAPRVLMARIVASLLLLSAFLGAGPAWAIVVNIDSPADGSTLEPPANITLSAHVGVPDGGYTVSKVEFFYGATLIGTDTTAPYSITWNNPPSGNYALTAKVTEAKSNGATQTATSSVVSIRVDAYPVVTLTRPAEGTTYSIPPSITVSAAANDSDGTISKVEFYDCFGGALLATVTAPPYSFAWTPPPPYWSTFEGVVKYETYGVIAYATDNLGGTGYSSCVSVSVAPSVTLTSPANGASFAVPASIAMTAALSPSDAPIEKMQFYNGATLIGEALSAPYTFTWQNVSAGTYSLTARALYYLGSMEQASPPVNVTVTAASTLYYIVPDHLDTPRLIANQQGATVWRWDQQEPFGSTPPNDNPSGLGSFDFPLRFPGQYYDKESGVAHNYLRDYDATTSRYVESDPIGLIGGLNTYSYALASPLFETDSTGLSVTVYCRPVGTSGSGFFHCFVQVTCPTEGWSKTFSLFANWSLRSGYKQLNDPADDIRKATAVGTVAPKACMADQCGYEKTIDKRFGSFPSGSVYYRLFGPNSNSFVNGLLLGNLPAGAPGPDLAPGIDIPHPGFQQR
jgi:RHS repeat-associated protein